MRPARQLIASIALLFMAGPAMPQAQVRTHEGEWVSYRDAYRVMVAFEKYGGPKHFLQNQLRVVPKERGAIDGLQLTLAGKSTQLNLPLDPLGRAVFPLQKAAYDENAVLLLNRKGAAFALRPQVSIAVRPDGVYDSADLRAACGEALGFVRWLDASQRSRQCAGVRFVFPKKAEGGARLRHDGTEQVLPALPGAAFAGDADEGFPTVSYRFGGVDHAQVVTHDAPLAIVPVFE